MDRPKAYALDEDVTPRAINACIYSYPGVGKTALWGTGDRSVLIMDSDDGIDSAKALGSKALVVPVRDYDDLAGVAEWAQHDLHKEHPEVRWISWDSLTLFQDRALIDDLLVDAHAENPRQSEDVASQREYLMNMNRIGKYVRIFVGLPYNFGISAHVMTDVNPEDELIYMPAITGKRAGASFSSFIMGYMNVVGYLGLTPSGTRRMLTQPTGHYFAKDRFHALRTNGKGHLDNPTLPKIEALIKGARSSGAAPASPSRPRRPVRKAAAPSTK